MFDTMLDLMHRTVLAGLGCVALAVGTLAPSVDRARAESADPAHDAAPCAERLAGKAAIIEIAHRDGSGRLVPITIFAPVEAGTYPLIGFSHGAYATPARYAAMLEPLAAAGHVVIAPMHIDSEEFPRAKGDPERPPHPVTWATRNADMALALAPDEAILAELSDHGLALAPGKVIAAGHSYGALIAQLAGGAIAIEPDGGAKDRSHPDVDAVIAFSPPGPMPGLIAPAGWQGLSVPALTITGTADILPGFIDDWKAHMASHENAPEGARALWVGEGIDHYFGGAFGRPGEVSEADARLFARALERSLAFIDEHAGKGQACAVSASFPGERYEKD